MKKGIIVTITACAMLIFAGNITTYAADSTISKSGDLSQDKLTRDELLNLENTYSFTYIQDPYEVEPVTKAPYKAGSLKSEVKTQALDYLNAVRKVAGVPKVSISEEYCDIAQHGTVVLAASGKFTHFPSKPNDMSEEFYKIGYKGTSSSNLSAGYGSVIRHVEGCLADGVSSYAGDVGHRRWLLSPSLGNVGFGQTRGYAATYVFGKSDKSIDYDFISWPSSGIMPSNLWESGASWSVALNPAKYATPKKDDIVITVTSSDGELGNNSWVFDKNSENSQSSDSYTVSTINYGGSNCIIFNLSDFAVKHMSDTYTVNIAGIKDKKGNDVQLNYKVDFMRENQTNGWKSEDGVWKYYKNDVMQTGWISDGSKWYYLDGEGSMKTGWLYNGNKWYYLNSSGAMQTGWLQSGNNWYYFNEDGSMKTGWLQSGNNWYYLNADGVMKSSCWLQSGNKWYYMQANGAMKTSGWQLTDNSWYYIDESGEMQTGWLQLGSEWYYLNEYSGAMQTGWLQSGGKWYYMDDNGIMVTDTKVGNYYIDLEGVCTISINKTDITLNKGVSEVLKVTYPPTAGNKVTWTSKNNDVATVDENGKVTALKEGKVVITATIGDYSVNCDVFVENLEKGIKINKTETTLNKGVSEQLYISYSKETENLKKTVEWTSSDKSIVTVDKQGKLTAVKAGTAVITVKAGSYTDSCKVTVSDENKKSGWIEEADGWAYYIDNVRHTGWLLSGNNWYYLNEFGVMSTGWMQNGGKIYYLNNSGQMQTGWVKNKDNWYYLNSNGVMKTGWVNVDGTWYYMNTSGAMHTGWSYDAGKWYYMKSSGAMAIGWNKIGGLWYYMNTGGDMAVNTYIGNYYVNNSGVWIQ